MKRIVLFLALLLFTHIVTTAQTLSTDTFSNGNSNLPAVGSTFDVPIDVTGIGTITNITIYFEVDTEVVDYVGINDGLAGTTITVNPYPSNNEILSIEVNSSVGPFVPFAVPDGKLVDLEFTFLGGDSDFTFHTTDNPPASGFLDNVGSPTYFSDADVTNGGVFGGTVQNIIDGGNWTTAGNWSLGVVPNSWHEVAVDPGSVATVDGDGVAETVTVTDGGQLTLATGVTLTVDDYFVVKSGGSYIENGTLAASGAITAERLINGFGGGDDLDGWHFLSSPVNGQDIDPAFVQDPFDFYRWNESSGEWENYEKTPPHPGFTDFEVGKGYLVAYQNNLTGVFTADVNGFNTDDVGPINVTNNGPDPQGFNLLGNPYPSALTWDDNWSPGNVASYAKIWRESSASYKDIDDGEIIPALNGFMVYTYDAATTFTIAASDRTHDATAWYKDAEQEIVLLAHDIDQEVYQESVIKFDESATPGFDQFKDSRFLYGYAPALYSFADDVKISTNAMAWNQDLIIPFHFEKNASSSFMIELAESIEGEDVYLKDLKTNTTVNLTETGTYTFTSEEGDDPDRFEILFGVVGIEDVQPLASAHVYSNGDILTVANVEGETRMDVMDVQGRVLQTEEFNSNGYSTFDLELNTGIYLVRLYNSGEAKTTKVFVK